jgi:hypothetical protein
VLFVLFLLVVCICLDLQVFKIWDFGSNVGSREAKLAKPSQAKPSQAKPSQQLGKPSEELLAIRLREGEDQLTFAKRPG